MSFIYFLTAVSINILKPQFCVDLDGTIVHRRPNALTYLESLNWMVRPGSLSTSDQFSEDAFEGRKLVITFNFGRYFVTFRRGTRALLTFLAQRGTVHIVTHACKAYAEKIVNLLRFNCSINLELVCIRRPHLKSVPFVPALIIDDKPERWHDSYHQVVTIPTMSSATVQTDDAIFTLMTSIRAPNSVTFNKFLNALRLRLNDDVVLMVLEYLWFPMRISDWMTHLRKCRHCRAFVCNEKLCEYCEHTESDGSY